MKKVRISERHIVITPKARCSFPVLITPTYHPDDKDQKKNYSIHLLLDPEQIEQPGKGKGGVETPSLKKAYFNAARDAWGDDKKKWPKFRYGYSDVFRKGETFVTKDSGEIYDGYEGKIVIRAKTGEKYAPTLRDQYGKIITADNVIYGGCFVQAKVYASPYDYAGNRGVSFKLKEVMFKGDGERFGGVGGPGFDVEEEDDLESDQVSEDNDSSDDDDDY